MSQKQKTFQRPAGSPGHGPGFGPPMGMPAQKAKNFKGTTKRLIGYLRPYRLHLALVSLMAILSTVFSIYSPKLLGQATTKLFVGFMLKMKGAPGAHIDFAYIANIIQVLAVLYVISSVFNYILQLTMVQVAQRTVFDLRNHVNAKLARLPLRFFDAHTHGEILSRVTNDIDNISMTLQQGLAQFVTAIVTIVGVVIMMLTISPLLTVICLLTLPLSMLVTVGVAKRSQKHFIAQQRTLGELNGHVEEMFTGHKIVKAYGQENASITRFNAINDQLFAAGWQAQFLSGMIMPLMMVVSNIGYVLVSIVGGLLVTNGRIQIGDVQAFVQYTRQFSQPIAQTANMANIIQSTIASAERVFELLDEAEESTDPAEAVVVAQPEGRVRLENVDFSYKPDTQLIEDMSIDVKAGQVVAIVGPTGAGKTTLVNLLMRFYEINKGCITVDGTDIRSMGRGHLRSLFGMVLQDTWLFHGTIRDNIAYGQAGATDEEVVWAAKVAHADHFIRTLPEGYNTLLNEEASNISQGQRQLLTIARAVLADPAILILDEATSSVDTRTEVHIKKAMSELMKGRTSFVIAHRLSTIRDADLILVMNHGRVIEQGTHMELLAKGSFYAELYNSQFTGAQVAAS